MPNHYEELGVGHDASGAEIRRAFGRLAKKYHPDVDSSAESIRKFGLIKEAYDVLSHSDRRKNYDVVLNLNSELKNRKIAEERAANEASQKRADNERQKKSVDEKQNWIAQKERIVRLEKSMSRARWLEAERLIEEILAVDRRSSLAYAARGDIARIRGDLDEAQKNYSLAVQFDSQSAVYQRKYEEVLTTLDRPGAVSVRDASDLKVGPTLVMIFVVLVGAAYSVIAKEPFLFPGALLADQLTVGLLVMLFVSGLSIGASLTASNAMDPVDSGLSGAIVKIPPAIVLGFVAVINYWLAVGLYVMMGLTQSAFNRSLSRLIGFSGLGLAVFALAKWSNGNSAAWQTLLWGGNLIYMGAACGWFVADSLKRV